MKARHWFAAALALLPLSPAIAQDAAATIKTAEYALGMIRGPQRIDAINTLEYWGNGYAYAFGQSFHPDMPWPAFKITYHASLSYAVPAMRIDVMRSNPDGPGPIQGGGGLPLAAPQRQIQVVSGEYAWNESVPGAGFIAGSTATPAPGALRDRQLQLWTTPFGVLKMAERAGSGVKVTSENGSTVLTFPLQGSLSAIVMKVTLNAQNQPERVETTTKDPVLGEVLTETTYSDYKDLGEIPSDVQFPSHILHKQGGFPVLDLRVTKTDPNNPYVVFPVPEIVEKTPQGPQPVKILTEKIGDGVWYLTGGTHHSVAVEFRNYVTLIECPQNDERAQAVIDATRRAIPNKPIRYVVNTHHHFDHSGGLRTCAATGATIITQAANKPYYENIWRTQKPPIIEAVEDKRALSDGKQTLELHVLRGSNHSDTMLIAYLPKQKLLVEADVFNPPPANAPPGPVVKENVNLFDNIKRLHLDVQQIAPLHGRLATIGDLRRAIGEN